jgi:hypothetical protein
MLYYFSVLYNESKVKRNEAEAMQAKDDVYFTDELHAEYFDSLSENDKVRFFKLIKQYQQRADMLRDEYEAELRKGKNRRILAQTMEYSIFMAEWAAKPWNVLFEIMSEQEF